VTIQTDNMDLAGEMVADLVAYLGVSDLASEANFPKAMDEFKVILETVRGHFLV
jgi:hypothetical protein